MIRKWLNNIGPGTLVAAAFIGPGTVTLCSIAGASFGYSLLWAMLLSIIATIILQEMAARLGIITQKGLSAIIRTEIQHPIIREVIILLILLAIVIGNASYEAGNISGGVLGLETILGEISVETVHFSIDLLPLIIGLVAFTLLYMGSYKVVEKTLVGLVILMSISFLLTAIITKPDLFAILKGSFIPKFPEGSLLTIIGLIGTTVVPYNLFLHASLVKEKWNKEEELPLARKDTILSIALGGIVSMAIIITASGIPTTDLNNAADLALSLEPLYGSLAKYFLAIGLFAAGITSAITAPLASAYVVKGCLGWEAGLSSIKFKMVWMLILFLGVLFSSLGIKPIDIIKFAQVANGLLLPVIAGILLWMMNKASILGKHRNTKWQNGAGIIIVLFALFLGLKSILKVFNIL